jgi:hypothetical protein
MNKDDWRTFLRWLETATEKELETKLLRIEAWSASFRDDGARADARTMVAEILLEREVRHAIR